LITDNLNREIVKQLPLAEDLTVLFHVPPEKAYTADFNVTRLQTVKPLIEIAYKEALEGKVWAALTLNGLIYSSASGYNPAIALDALAAGAVAAGLCGKGPAVTTVAPKDKIGSVKAALKRYEGEILQARLNREKAKVL
jgi:shikimate kinase